MKTIIAPEIPEEVAQLNAEWFLCPTGGKVSMVREVKNEKGTTLEFYSSADFEKLYSNVHVPIGSGGKTMPLGKFWMSSAPRRQYSGGIAFDPRPDSPAEWQNKYNLWRGWNIQGRPGDWSRLRHHIQHVLSNGSEYTLRWIAHMLQKPWELPETSVGCIGDEGAGKGIVGRAIMRVCSPYSITVARSDHLTGKFNAHLAGKLFVFADEAFLAGDAKAVGTLLTMITEPQVLVEDKFKTAIQVDNYARLFCASNNEWIVPARHDARRYVVFEASSPSRSQHERDAYFSALVEEIENGGLEAMFHDLKGASLGTWTPRQIPQTVALGRQKERSLPPVPAWWLEVLSEGVLPGGVETGDWPEEASREALRKDYTEWHERYRPRSAPVGPRQFGKIIRKFGIKDGSRPGGRSDRSRTYEVPELAKARATFEHWLRSPIDWPPIEEKQSERVAPPSIVPFPAAKR